MKNPIPLRKDDEFEFMPRSLSRPTNRSMGILRDDGSQHGGRDEDDSCSGKRGQWTTTVSSHPIMPHILGNLCAETY
ncbi:Uncharacterized protein DBV15_05172 [Temnothorax longispinosus]|uniref:Uncharacterized protein n=1 Tax=Temnothorax longispinosus TaxID=300112 RepID=A0A4V3SBG5_9HYME|nr:Uncharacterized protein DBV15_05172 [Temnothorax longispinosus]